MIAVVTGVLAGSSAALVAAVASGHSLALSVPIGTTVGIGAIAFADPLRATRVAGRG
jgi:hypothetical protein